MHFVQLADPIPNQEPADVVRSLAFMANVAAQETTGTPDASRTPKQLLNVLQPNHPTEKTYCLVLVDGLANLSGSSLSELGYPLVPSTNSEDAVNALAYVVISAPILENTDILAVDIILDVDILPTPGGDFVELDSLGTEAVLTQCLTEVESIARQLGRTTLHLYQQLPRDVEIANSPFAQLYQRRGYSLGMEESIACIPVPEQPLDVHVPEGFQVMTLVNENFPVELVDSAAELYTRASLEVPHGLLKVEEEHWTPERLAEVEKRFRSQGTENFIALVCCEDPDDSRVVALSEIWTQAGALPEVAEQGLTYVVPDARGKGIGRAVKYAALNMMKSARPELRRIYTENAEENPGILALNRELGMSWVSRNLTWRKDLR